MKKFRFGASPGFAETATQWRELAKQVEAWGYSTLLLPDHFVNPFSPVPALAMAAEATTTLRVGTMVFDNDFRHPALLAKDAATIDFLSDGRFELGIGAGWHLPEYQATGIPFDAAAVRVARMKEAVAVLKGLWLEEPFSFTGEHYRIDGLLGMPTPVQRPHPPIMIGGGGRAVLSFAAREADIISFAVSFVGRNDGRPDIRTTTADAMQSAIDIVREAAGARLEQIELSNYYNDRQEITDDKEAAARAALDRMQQRFGDTPVSLEEMLESPHALFGSVDEVCDTLVERRERYGVSYIVISHPAIESFAPVVARLAGT
jgi:probable F420-dependent oxidoreductase